MVFVLGSREPESLEPILRGYEPSTGSFKCLALDLTSMESVRKFAAQVHAEVNKVHVLINNGEKYKDDHV